MAGKVPTFDELMNPLLRAMQALGGSGSVEEIYDKVVELERFPDHRWFKKYKIEPGKPT